MEIQWPLALFTLLSSMGGITFACVGLNEFTKKSTVNGFIPGLVAGVIAIIGGFCSVLHLAHVDRIMNALSVPTSGIFIEAALIGCLAVCVFIYLICLKREVAAGVKVFAVLGIVFGIALSFMAGHSYIMAARPAWDTELLPLGYLCTALPMGTALYWALAGKEEPAGKFSAMLTAICGVIALLSVAAYGAVSGSFSGAGALYCIGAVALAGVVPVIVGAISLKDPKPVMAWVAFASATVGALLYRVLMWVVGIGVFNFFG